jgi:hypothetical protein
MFAPLAAASRTPRMAAAVLVSTSSEQAFWTSPTLIREFGMREWYFFEAVE